MSPARFPHGDPEKDIRFQFLDRSCPVRGLNAGEQHPGIAGLPRYGHFPEGAGIPGLAPVVARKPGGRISIHHALRGSAAVVRLADVGDELPGAFGPGVREDRPDATVREPPDGVGGADLAGEDGHEVPRRVGFPLAVADLEDGHGEFLPRPVGAVALPVEDRGELTGGVDAIEDLCVPKPGQRVYMIEIPFHRLFSRNVFVNFDAMSPAKNKTKRNNRNCCKKSAEIEPSRGARNRPVSFKTDNRQAPDGWTGVEMFFQLWKKYGFLIQYGNPGPAPRCTRRSDASGASVHTLR